MMHPVLNQQPGLRAFWRHAEDRTYRGMGERQLRRDCLRRQTLYAMRPHYTTGQSVGRFVMLEAGEELPSTSPLIGTFNGGLTEHGHGDR